MFPLRFVDHMDSGTILTNGDQIAEEGQRGRQDSFQRDASKHKKGMKGKKNKRQRKRYDGKVVKLDSF